MIIITSSKIGKNDIKASLGKPEYSYYFLLREFIPALNIAGTVVEAGSTDEVDEIFHRYSSQGEDVVFLSFSPPQQTPLNLACPTIPVFAWEFDNTPDEAWENDPRNDWAYVFERVAAAITLSEEAATAVRKIAGESFPVLVVPAPVWDRFEKNFVPDMHATENAIKEFSFNGKLLDSSTLGLSADGLVQHRIPEPITPPPTSPTSENIHWQLTKQLFSDWWNEVRGGLPPHVTAMLKAPPPFTPSPAAEGTPQNPDSESHSLKIEGTIYTTVLNPGDHRKNVIDLISAFCWAFREEPKANLVVKMTHHDMESYRIHILTLLSRLAPFQCRVLVVHGFLDDTQYKKLVDISNFYVNSSVCEGLCLPLMEFLSSGKPAIAPDHTAMHDYVDKKYTFLLSSSRQPASWPHDPSGKLKTHLHRLNWESLMSAYQASFVIANDASDLYRRMSSAAYEQMKEYCSLSSITSKLSPFLVLHATKPSASFSTKAS